MLHRLCLLAVLLLLPTCSKGTYLEIEFTGTLSGVRQIGLTFSYTPTGQAAETRTNTFMPPGGGDVKFPSSLVLELNTLAVGDIALTARALDAGGAQLATSSAMTTVHHDTVWKVEMPPFGGSPDGGVTDGGTHDALADAQGADAQGADGCTVTEVKANESVSILDQGMSSASPGSEVLWAGSSNGGLYSSWIKFPTRGSLVPPVGTKLSAIHLVMHTNEVKGMSFGAQIFYSGMSWTAANPPPANPTNLTTVSDVIASTPPANSEITYPLMTVKAWADLITLGPVTFVVRNVVGGTPATAGSLIAFQGVTTGAGSANVPVLRFRFCPN
jgi:hypothetical protein